MYQQTLGGVNRKKVTVLSMVDLPDDDCDDHEHGPEEPRECQCCGKNILPGREITCPNCYQVFCYRCVETMDDCFMNWCQFCIGGE